MKRIDGGWLLTDAEVEAVVMNQLGIQLGKASVLTLATPRERAVLDAMGEAHEDTLRFMALHGATALAKACVAELARRGLKP